MTMPTGDSGLPASAPDDSSDAGAGAAPAGWMPIFKLGSSTPGMPTDGRGYMTGTPAQAVTANDVAAAGVNMASQAIAVIGDQSAGDTPGTNQGGIPGLGGYSSMPTGGADAPDAAGYGAGGLPLKATSAAQRAQNIANAQANNPGYVG